MDSRLRGNDVMVCGNDVMVCGNDVMVCGNGVMVCGNGVMVCGDDVMVCGSRGAVCDARSWRYPCHDTSNWTGESVGKQARGSFAILCTRRAEGGLDAWRGE